LQAHCQSRTRPSTDQSFAKELAKPTQDKIVLKKIPTLQKKTHTRHSMTQKINIDNGLQGRTTRTTGYNSRLPQWGLTWLNQALCFYQSWCLVDSESLRNPPLRQAAKRYMQA
jgi:hypothetical protein